VTITLNIRETGARDLINALNRFDRAVAQRATAQALNRTINNMRATAIKEGSRWLGVKQSAIERRYSFDIRSKHGAIGIKGARARVRMEAVATARGRPFNLIRWGAVRVPGGVVANAWNNAKLYPGLGITRAPASFVFKVRDAKQGKKRIGRGAYGPGLTSAMTNTTVARSIERTGNEKFLQHFVSAANYHLERDGWGGRVGTL